MERRRSFLTVLVTLLILVGATESVAQKRPQQPFLRPAPEAAPLLNEVLVQFAAGVPAEWIATIHRAVGATPIRIVPLTEGVLHVVIVPDGETPAEIAAHYRSFKGVVFAESQAVYHPRPRR